MNIYAETNFVLELVLEQEECSFCEQILALCSSGKVHLILPAYCLAEPHEKLIRQSTLRKDLQQRLEQEVIQLSRTASYSTSIQSITEISKILGDSSKAEKQRFIHYRNHLLNLCDVIPLTSEILNEAGTYEVAYRFSPQDAIVYTSVLAHLRRDQPRSALFLNRNSKDFKKQAIVDQLQHYQCKLITMFEDGFNYACSIQS